MKWLIVAAIGQWAACVLLSVGIAIEVTLQANIGFLAITLGSALFAGITKMEYHGRRWADRNQDHNRRGTD